jgi:hypothetical protein
MTIFSIALDGFSLILTYGYIFKLGNLYWALVPLTLHFAAEVWFKVASMRNAKELEQIIEDVAKNPSLLMV